MLNKPRNADIVARTHTELLYIEKEDFLRFLRDTPLPEMLIRLDKNRWEGARWTFEKNRILAALSPMLKNQLMCHLKAKEVKAGTSLYEVGDPVQWYYLIDSGEVLWRKNGWEVVLGAGSFVGEFGPSLGCLVHSCQARALSDLKVFTIRRDEMRAFIKSNPGTYVRMGRSLSDILRRQGRPVEEEGCFR